MSAERAAILVKAIDNGGGSELPLAYVCGCRAYLKRFLADGTSPSGEGECARDVRGFLNGSWTLLDDLLEVDNG